MKAKVLFLAYDERLGLTYHFVDWVAALHHAAKGQYDIWFVTGEKEQEPGLHKRLQALQLPNVVVIRGSRDLWSLDCLKYADIVHCHGFSQLRALARLRTEESLRYKIIVTIHAFRNLAWYKTLFANAVSAFCVNHGADMVHFLSQTSKNEFLRLNFLYRSSNESCVFPLGCSEQEFARVDPGTDLPFQADLLGHDRQIAYLAKFTRGKQHMWLITTLRQVLVQESATLWLFGDGKEKANVARYVAKEGLQRYIRMPGRVPRNAIPWLLSRMRFAVCTSRSENSPHSIMEPLFAGIPVITFDVGTASYLIRDFTTGFIIQGNSERQSFADKAALLLRDAKLAGEMGRNAREFALRWLTWEACAQNVVRTYSYMLSSLTSGVG